MHNTRLFEKENLMKITPMSTLSDVLNNPVGYDIAQKVISDLLKQMTKPIVFTESQTKESSILK